MGEEGGGITSRTSRISVAQRFGLCTVGTGGQVPTPTPFSSMVMIVLPVLINPFIGSHVILTSLSYFPLCFPPSTWIYSNLHCEKKKKFKRFVRNPK